MRFRLWMIKERFTDLLSEARCGKIPGTRSPVGKGGSCALPHRERK